MTTILIVDDDRAVVELLEAALSRYTTVFASDGAGALHQVAAEHPDLVLLDLRMPGMDGALVLPKIREISTVPIIVLSARHEQSDIVGAFKAGADDVVSKPFELGDLEARVEAVLRRSKVVELPENDGVYTAGSLDISSTRLATIAGRAVHLTPIEHKMLVLLARYVDQVVTRDQLIAEVWESPAYRSRNLVNAHLERVRRRLDRTPGAPAIITVRGRGWMLRTNGGTIP